jgi:hypothetical protein
MRQTDRLVWGVVAHEVADWLLQNHWMATNKANPNHPAGIVHAGIHALAMMFVFPVRVSLLLGAVHYLIDLRCILAWWRKFYQQTQEGEAAMHVAIWGDQVAHVVTIAITAWFSGDTK